ncbi:hypothetical protein [Paenibacillus sp. FSL K6-1230]|uniref:hypothetical protein n=1 Tax=Paenibacillus sp. FSL K6-1230 TaxID=2921603 RepID=UPI0003A2610F
MVQTIAELDLIREECRSMVAKRAAVSGTVSLLPVPGADVLTDVGILMELLPSINKKFKLSQEQLEGLDAETKSMIYGFITSVGSKIIGRVVTHELILQLLRKMGVRIATKQVSRFVPILGQGLSAAIGYTAMRIIGNRHVDECYEVAKHLLEQRNLAAAVQDAQTPQITTEPLEVPDSHEPSALLLPPSKEQPEPVLERQPSSEQPTFKQPK